MPIIDEPRDDARDSGSDRSGRIPLLSYMNKMFLRRRAQIILFIIIFLIGFAIAFTSVFFILKRKQFRRFKSKVTDIIEREYPTLDASTRLAYIDELVKIHETHKISDDAPIEVEAFVEFKSFNKKYNRMHRDFDHIVAKFLIFRKSFFEIKNHGKDEIYSIGINKFADMDEEEFNSLHHEITPPKFTTPARQQIEALQKSFDNKKYIEKLKKAKNIDEIDPKNIRGDDLDWRRADSVTPIKDQGLCGSCWAFATIGSVEAVYKLYEDKTYSLSEQELINCDKWSHGCNGGLPFTALEYIHHHGISQTADMPYIGIKGPCNVNHKDRVRIHSLSVSLGLDILNRSLVMSPTIVAIAVDPSLKLYEGGIYTGKCGQRLNHAVLLVGEGFDEDTRKRYWIIKNSWGEDWGERGYLRLERTNEKRDKCNILTFGINPILQ